VLNPQRAIKRIKYGTTPSGLDYGPAREKPPIHRKQRLMTDAI
jgi:hypothetical protein